MGRPAPARLCLDSTADAADAPDPVRWVAFVVEEKLYVLGERSVADYSEKCSTR
jgi:hypothetical protein